MMDTNEPDKKTPSHWDETLSDKYLCFMCFCLVFPPMQLTCCGKRLCEWCAASGVKQHQCPHSSKAEPPEARLDRGFLRELNKQEVNCPRCTNWSGPFPQLKTHLLEHCDLQCPNCDEKFVFPQQVDKHQQETCKKRKVPCVLSFIGCSHKVPFSELSEHNLSVEHQNCLLSFVVSFFPSLHGRGTMGTLQKSVDEPEQRLLEDCQEKIRSLIEQMDRGIGKCHELTVERQIKEAKINEIRTQSTKIKESADNNMKLIEGLHQLLIDMGKVLEEIKSKPVAGPQLLTSDGIFIWNLNFSALINHGQSILSEPFHTSQSGYKLALRADLYKENSSQKQFLSLAFIILRGEFDAILLWPVLFPITISIIDFSARKKDISYDIPTESRTLAFSRPVHNANPPFSIEKFYPVEKLSKDASGYVQNGFLYVKARIDFFAAGTK